MSDAFELSLEETRAHRNEAIGLAFTRCPGFRFRGGMLLVPQQRFTRDLEPWRPFLDLDHDESVYWPDFRDPATWGCLLASFRDLYPGAYVRAIYLPGPRAHRYVMVYPRATDRPGPRGPRGLADSETLSLLAAWQHPWAAEAFARGAAGAVDS